MSKLTEIQDRYRGYLAASEAVKKTNPGKVEVVYKKEAYCEEGVFVYWPGDNDILIYPRRGDNNNRIRINADDVPALIKALREFFE
jgi:hypothetical protein